MFLRFLTEKLVLDAEEPKEIPTSLIFLTTVSSEKEMKELTCSVP